MSVSANTICEVSDRIATFQGIFDMFLVALKASLFLYQTGWATLVGKLELFVTEILDLEKQYQNFGNKWPTLFGLLLFPFVFLSFTHRMASMVGSTTDSLEGGGGIGGQISTFFGDRREL